MKFENFDRAEKLVDKIKKYTRLHTDLSGTFLATKVVVNGGGDIIVIEPNNNTFHECKQIGKRFIEGLKLFYENKLKELYEELEAL